MGERLYSTGDFSRAFQSKWKPQMALLRTLLEDVGEEIAGWNDVFSCDAEVSEIEIDHLPGFIPTTQGGFDLCHMGELGLGHGSGAAPKGVQEYIDRSLKDAGDGWLKGCAAEFGYDPEADYGDETWGRAWAFVNWLEEAEAVPEGQGTLPMHLPRYGSSLSERAKESLGEYEDEALRGEGATYFYKVRAILYAPESHLNETGEPEVLICAGLNTDFGYGRDSKGRTRWTTERTIPLRLVTEELTAELRGQIIRGLADA